MRMHPIGRATAAVTAALLLGSCGGSARPHGAGSASNRIASTARGVPGGGRCPVTRPRPWAPPPGVSRGALTYGNGKLWVGLWPHGVIEAGGQFVNEDGSVSMKFPWWRNVSGYLRITGRRVDGHAPPLRADVPDGYGTTGFQASGVVFPTPGCWQVIGKAGTASLTFVTFVIKLIA
jgi:hypothetical protein